MKNLFNIKTFSGLAIMLFLSMSAFAQSNDDCSGAIPLACNASISGTTSGASVGVADFCGTNASAPDVWYTVEAIGSEVIFSLCGSSYDTKLSIYTGTCGGLVCEGGNDDACGLQSQVTLPTTAGTTYYVRVHGFGSGSGAFTLSTTCEAPPPGDCSQAVAVSCNSTTVGSTVGASNDDAPFCGTGDGSGGGVWYTLLGDGSDVTVTTCDPGTTYDTKIRVYTGSCASPNCVAGDDDNFCSNGSNLTSLVEFNAAAGVTYYILVHGFGSSEGTFVLSVDCVVPPPPPVNDDCATATPIVCNGASVTGNTENANFDDVGFCGTSNTAEGVWHSVIGTGGTFTVTTSNPGTDYDTKLGVFTSVNNPCDGNVDCIDGDDDGGAGLTSEIEWNTVAGVEYLILVHGFGGSTGNYELTLECIDPLVLTSTGDCQSQFVGIPGFETGINYLQACAEGGVGPYTFEWSEADPNAPATEDLTLTLTTDNFAGETNWTLTSQNGDEIGSNGTLANNTTYVETFAVAPDCSYEFEITDSFGDGICCGFGTGSWSIDFMGTTTNSPSGGAFGSIETVVIGTPGACVPYVAPPSTILYEQSNDGICTDAAVMPSELGITTYTVTVTDANGATSTEVIEVNVVSVDCSNNNNNYKVLICHEGLTLCVSENAVESHFLSHADDHLGPCGNPCVGTGFDGNYLPSVVQQNFCSDEGGVALPNGISTFTIQVPDSFGGGTLADLNVFLDFYSSEWGDIEVFITSPWGYDVYLWNPNDIPNQFFSFDAQFVSTLDDEGVSVITNGAQYTEDQNIVTISSAFEATDFLSTYDLHAYTGTWTLTINNPGTTANLNSWCLETQLNEPVIDCLGELGGPALNDAPCDDGNPDSVNDRYCDCDCSGQQVSVVPGAPTCGDCLFSNGSPGCQEPVCEALICASDAFCCNTSWDGICAAAAADDCDCAENGNDDGLTDACEADCTGELGGVNLPGAPCDDNDPNTTNDVYQEDCTCAGSPPCVDATLVMIMDSFGGETSWNIQENGSTVASAGTGTYPNFNNGQVVVVTECLDPTACVDVNIFDSFGDGGPDWTFDFDGNFYSGTVFGSGGNQVSIPCGGGGSPVCGNCLVSNGSPGCDEPICEALICGQDPFCCNTTWDGICAAAAASDCDCADNGPTGPESSIAGESMISAYPNPTSSVTNMEFLVQRAGNVDVSLYSMDGRKILTIFNGNVEAGAMNVVNFDATDITSGIYIYQLISNREVLSGTLSINR